MLIGIVGIGTVGGAVYAGLQRIGQQCVVHDLRMDTALRDLLDCDIVYVCVPTPSAANGECDVSVVEAVVSDLAELDYRGIIAIKSTVIPGTTQRLIEQHRKQNICFVPEFLRETCAEVDFLENNNVLIVGTHRQEVFDQVCASHGDIATRTSLLRPTEAEYSKYFNNAYNALRIVFANSMYAMCQAHPAEEVNYAKIKSAIAQRPAINDHYLDCYAQLRGFAGMCLPKDVTALNVFQKKHLGLDLKLFATMLEENQTFGQ